MRGRGKNHKVSNHLIPKAGARITAFYSAAESSGRNLSAVFSSLRRSLRSSSKAAIRSTCVSLS